MLAMATRPMTDIERTSVPAERIDRILDLGSMVVDVLDAILAGREIDREKAGRLRDDFDEALDRLIDYTSKQWAYDDLTDYTADVGKLSR